MSIPTRAADVMVREVATASPRWTLSELERRLCERKVSGFPVVDGDALVGVVSRTDIIRQLSIERSRAGEISSYFRGDADDPQEAFEDLREAEHFVAERMLSWTKNTIYIPPPLCSLDFHVQLVSFNDV